MRTTLTILSALILLIQASPGAALGPLDVQAELGVFSKYVWRGMIETDEAVLQPVIAADLLGFGAEIWGNLDLTDAKAAGEVPGGAKGKFSELTYTLSYGVSLPMLRLEAGVSNYTYPNTPFPTTTELYAAAEAQVLLNPALAVYYDVDEIDGSYVTAGVSHGLPLSPLADLRLAAVLGYGSGDYVAGYFGAAESAEKAAGEIGAGLTDVLLTVALPYRPLPMVTITPSLAYASLMGDAQDAVKAAGADKDAVVAGITASLSF